MIIARPSLTLLKLQVLDRHPRPEANQFALLGLPLDVAGHPGLTAFKTLANKQLSIAGLVTLDKNAVLALATNVLAPGRDTANEATDIEAQIAEHLDAAETAIKKLRS